MPNLSVSSGLTTTAQYVSDGTNNSALAVATTRVGVGTTTFVGNEALIVQNNSDGAQLLVRRNNASKYAYVTVMADNTNAVAWLGIGGSSRSSPDNNTTIICADGTSQNGINFKLQTTVAMRLDSAGKLGIGTSSPSETLDVNGAVKVGTRSDSGASPGTVRWNSGTSKLQVYDGSVWVNLH